MWLLFFQSYWKLNCFVKEKFQPDPERQKKEADFSADTQEG